MLEHYYFSVQYLFSFHYYINDFTKKKWLIVSNIIWTQLDLPSCHTNHSNVFLLLLPLCIGLLPSALSPLLIVTVYVCVCCPTLPPLSAYGRRPICQQHGQSPHTPPLGQEGSLEGTPAQSGSHWAPPLRSGPPQEHPDQCL